MGFVAVLGIAVRNTILLVGRYRQLEIAKAKPLALRWLTRHRRTLGPILMSAVAIGTWSVLPFASVRQHRGLEIAHPMAIVVLGGLVTTTLVSLVGVPAMSVVCGTADGGTGHGAC